MVIKSFWLFDDSLVPVLDSPAYVLIQNGELIITNYCSEYSLEDIKKKINECKK